MRLTTVLLIVCMVQVSAAGLAQKITLNAHDAALSSVLREIGKQSGYGIFFDGKVLPGGAKVTVVVSGASVSEALDEAFRGLDLTYKIEGNTIAVMRREAPSFLDRVVAVFAAVDVRGKVVDSLGNGLAGATVSVKGGKAFTATDAGGNFLLKNVDENAVLVVSYIGYVTKEQQASKEFNYVILRPSSSPLDEVMVKAYGVTTQRLSTGNIATVKAKDIAAQNVNNPLLALQGRVPGLEITPLNGLPGAPVNIQIRGQYSLRPQGNDPLIVIDGVPYTNNITGLGSPAGNNNNYNAGQMSAFSFINPNEIESISVLKDADATSIYGSRGSKGVILITTKKGKAGKTSADITVNSGWQNDVQKLKLLNTEQYLQMRKDALANDNRLSRLDDPATYGLFYPDLLLWDQHKYTDWQKVLLGKTGRYNDVQGSVSGGINLVQYRLGGTYHKETYVYPGDAYDRKGSAEMSVSGASPDQKFKVTVRAQYMFDKNLAPPEDMTRYAMTLAPNAPNLYNANGEINWQPDPYSSAGQGSFNNPLALLKKTFTQKVNSLITSADLSYQLLSGLIIKLDAGYTKLDGNSFTILSSLASSDPAFAASSGPYLRQASFMNTSAESWSVEPQITYTANIGSGKLDALLGASLQSQNASSSGMQAEGFSDDALMQSLGQATQYSFISNTTSEYKYNAGFARLSYNWLDKYLINLSGRRDGSSRFGPGRQFGNFGSIGSAWIFSQENFVKSALTFLSFGKLRFSYGTSGNDGIGDYQFMELYNPVTLPESYRGIKLISSSGLSNPYFGWESVTKMEVGLDLGFFKDRLNLSASHFRNRSSNLLGIYFLPGIAGPGYITINQPALIQTMGWEFIMSSRNISGSQFTWNSSFNFTVIRNKKLADNDGNRRKPGLGQPFYGYTGVAVFNGVDPATGQYQFLAPDKTSTFIPSNAAQKTIMIDPAFDGGFSNSFTYKRFSLDVFLQFKKQNGKNYIYQFGLPGSQNNQPVEVVNRWRAPGDVAPIQRSTGGRVNPVPDITLFDAYNAVSNSTAGWVDASFIRVKTVSLSYSISDSWKKKMHLQAFRIFAQGQNLFTLTKYKGTDPETQLPFALPPLRTITAGIQITL